VIGVPGDIWREIVKALIVLKPGAAPDVADIIAGRAGASHISKRRSRSISST
jgi:predicted nicotinamide N-methyase